MGYNPNEPTPSIHVGNDPNVATLLSNASATGPGCKVAGGTYIWSAVGTFSGATLTLEFLGPDNTTYVAISGVSLTANGSAEIDATIGAIIRCVVTGGSPSGLYSTLERI